MAENVCDGSDIQIFGGPGVIRERPGMYIGSTDSKGLRHLVWETIDNSIDEALNGRGDTIRITTEKDNVICMEDGGRGVPVDMYASGIPAVQIIYTALRTGGKFSVEGDYRTSGGLYGIGASAVNALNEWVEVMVHRDDKIYRMSFSDGGCGVSKLEVIGKANKTGGKVRLRADRTIFSTTKYSFHQITERTQKDASLLEGLKLVVRGEREGEEYEEVYHYERGLVAFMKYLHKDKQVFHEPVVLNGMSNDIRVDCVFQYTDEYQRNIFSFINIIRIKDGGTYETGARNAFTRVFNKYAGKNGLLREKDKNFEGSDVREGLAIILSLGVPKNFLQLGRRTKDKLKTAEAKATVNNIVDEKLSFFLEENKELAIALIRKTQRASTVHRAARKAREDARRERVRGKTEKILSRRLASVQSKDAKREELYLVEEDSAGDSTEQGRNNEYQAILPLHGKVLNTERTSVTNVEENEELNTITRALGADMGADLRAGDSSCHRVIIMTDTGTDSTYIQILLLTFFYRCIRGLVEQGIMYIALPPLYKL